MGTIPAVDQAFNNTSRMLYSWSMGKYHECMEITTFFSLGYLGVKFLLRYQLTTQCSVCIVLFQDIWILLQLKSIQMAFQISILMDTGKVVAEDG